MRKNLLQSSMIIVMLVTSTSFSVIAQNQKKSTVSPVPSEKVKAIHPANNLVKINITALFLKNYAFQYERVLSRKLSVSLGYRTMPATTLPFKSSIIKMVDDEDPETTKTINNLRLSNTAITPEVRLYLSRKGYGQGFFIGAFYRHATYKSEGLDIYFSDNTGTEKSMKLSGDLKGNTGGLLIGFQHGFGKRIVLDTWIFGPHYGSARGSFVGKSSAPLTQDEQDALLEELNNIEIPLTDKTVFVNANGASVNLDGPWGGIRAGLSLGFRF